MAHVLVIEDEQDILEVLSYNLEQAGHTVTSSLLGAPALQLAERRSPDIILLDLMLPDMTGTELCRLLKERPQTRQIPLIMLTARSEEIDRVVGFELGADDYVTKPFSMRELLLRVQAVLRRRGTLNSAVVEPEAGAAPDAGAERFGCLKISRESHRVWVSDRSVELTALELRLLLTLFDRRDRVQNRSQLLDQVWGIRADITTRTVDTHVKRLREKLLDARSYIETVRGVGYRFVASPD